MKNTNKILCMLCCFLLSATLGYSQGFSKVQVRVTNTPPPGMPSTLVDDFTKNHIIIKNNSGNGFLTCDAAYKNPTSGNYWVIRLTSTDANLNVLWSKEINLLTNHNHSTTPFAISSNKTGNGYVVTGIWDPKQPSLADIAHDGVQCPFYIETDNSGTVINSSMAYQPALTQGYTPLSIAPYGNGYISVGVWSNTMKHISGVAPTSGYISILDQNFVETQKRIFTGISLSSPPAPHTPQTQRFDALNKIKPIPASLGGGFIVSGTVTGNLMQTAPPAFNLTAGSCDGYIARLDNNLNIVWEKTMHDNNGANNYNIMDFAIDESNGTVIAGGNAILTASCFYDHGYSWVVNVSTGQQLFSQTIEATSTATSHTRNVISNVFVNEDYYYLCGYGQDGYPGSNISMSGGSVALHPLVLKFDKVTNQNSGSFIVDGQNVGYWASSTNLYTGYLSTLYTAYNGLGSNQNINTYDPWASQPYLNTKCSTVHTPIIYYPSGWLLNKEDGLVCHTLRDIRSLPIANINHPSPAACDFYPIIYKNLENFTCNKFIEEPYKGGDADLQNASIIFGNNTKMFENVVTYDYLTTNVTIMTVDDCQPGPVPKLVGNNSIKNESTINLITYPNPSQSTIIFDISIKGVSATTKGSLTIMSITGKEMYSNTIKLNGKTKVDLSSLSNGTYLYKITFDGHVKTGKILISK